MKPSELLAELEKVAPVGAVLVRASSGKEYAVHADQADILRGKNGEAEDVLVIGYPTAKRHPRARGPVWRYLSARRLTFSADN